VAASDTGVDRVAGGVTIGQPEQDGSCAHGAASCGDCGEIDSTTSGKTVAAWGEGFSSGQPGRDVVLDPDVSSCRPCSRPSASPNLFLTDS